MDYKRKEILTKEIIEKELKKEYYSATIAISAVVLMLVLFYAFLWFICKSLVDPNFSIMFVFCIVLLILLFLGVFGYAVYWIINCFTLMNNYSIVTDSLCEIDRTKASFFSHHTYPFFRFKNYGIFLLSYSKIYYRWSEFYHMDGYGLDNCSVLGDDFYLVVVNKKSCTYIIKRYLS